MRRPSAPASLLFRLSAVAGGLFVVTILAQIVVVISNSPSPGARWLDRHGGQLFAIEVLAILGLGFAAMAQDRKQTLNQKQNADPEPTTPPPEDS